MATPAEGAFPRTRFLSASAPHAGLLIAPARQHLASAKAIA